MFLMISSAASWAAFASAAALAAAALSASNFADAACASANSLALLSSSPKVGDSVVPAGLDGGSAYS